MKSWINNRAIWIVAIAFNTVLIPLNCMLENYGNAVFNFVCGLLCWAGYFMCNKNEE